MIQFCCIKNNNTSPTPQISKAITTYVYFSHVGDCGSVAIQEAGWRSSSSWGHAVFMAERSEQERACRNACNGFGIFCIEMACIRSPCKWHAQTQHPWGGGCVQSTCRNREKMFRNDNKIHLRGIECLWGGVLSFWALFLFPCPEQCQVLCYTVDSFIKNTVIWGDRISLSLLRMLEIQTPCEIFMFSCFLLILFPKNLTLSQI